MRRRKASEEKKGIPDDYKTYKGAPGDVNAMAKAASEFVQDVDAILAAGEKEFRIKREKKKKDFDLADLLDKM